MQRHRVISRERIVASSHAIWRFVAVLTLLCALSWRCGAVTSVHAQTGVVGPGDVSTPAPTKVPLPTPTATPRSTQPVENEVVDGGYATVVHALPTPSYIISEGDTLWTVALEMGLDLDVMPCIVGPHYRRERPLVVGDTLVAPGGELFCHSASAGDTISSIAAVYQVDPTLLLADAWNELGVISDVDAVLDPGRYIRIVVDNASALGPGFFSYMLDRSIEVPPMMALARGGPVQSKSQALVPEYWPYGSGQFDWPSTGWITQGYRNDHRAVDIAAPQGTAVTASDRGVVLRAGWNNQGYGMFVVVDHNIDYVTLYSHLQEVFVSEGDIVAQGQVLGTVGSTGNSTGPHLHFEVRDFGSRINPLEVLVR